MSPEELKSLACRHLEATWMQYSRQPADTTCSFSHEEARCEGEPPTLEQVRRAIHVACPDLALTIETVIAEAGQVVACWTVRGTDTQGYRGRLPTGKQVTTTGIQMTWFEDEHLVRVWEIADLMEILSQLGFICTPEPPRVTVRPIHTNSPVETPLERSISTVESTKRPLEHAPLSGSLPIYLTRFVGREHERATVTSLLLSKRLLTLVGAGGIGKTRLAFQVATELEESFPDGVFVIELASLSESQLVAQAIMTTLNIHTNQDTPPISLLISTLGEHHILLLLDNCEHVLTGCAPVVEALLQACPHLYILITSREPLAVTGEMIWRVPTLSSPHPEQIPPVEQLSSYEAIQLFC